MLWPREEPGTTPTTDSVAVDEESPTRMSTTTTVAPTTTAEAVATETASHVVTTTEEAEEILRELWFGWFEGIYNQDEERIKQVVGSQQMLDAARDAFGSDARSTPLEVSDVEILHSAIDCLVLYGTLSISRSSDEAQETSVHVLRRIDDHWVFLSIWVQKDDLWQQDCESVLEPLS